MTHQGPVRIEFGATVVDLDRGVVSRPGERSCLTPMETALLARLVAAGGSPVKRETLLTDVWGYRSTETRTVATTVRRLRRKLEPEPSSPRWLLTVAGGYRLELPGPSREVAPVLPEPAVGFVGRESELDQILIGLESGRLVSLVGPGGAGKTELALRAARRWRGPVAFVELAGRHHSIASAVGRTLGFQGAEDATTLASSVAGLGALLLVLDDLDHGVEDAARLLPMLLRLAPELRVLATSREAMAIGPEHVVEVAGLPDELAVRLLMERTGTRAEPALWRIAARVDGLPLGLELAASWIPLLGAGQLADRLDDRLTLLTTDRRDRPARHRSMAAAVHASWELLEDHDRSALRQAAVFAGAFSVVAAEAVLDLPDPLGAVRRLCSRSLARAEGGWVRLYAPVADFVEPDPQAIGRHREWAVELARLAERADSGGDGAALNRLDAAFADLVLAARRAAEGDDLGGVLELVSAVLVVGRWRGRRHEAVALAESVRGRVSGLEVRLASVYRLSGRLEDAGKLIDEALESDPSNAAMLRERALWRRATGDLVQARQDLEAARQLGVGNAQLETLATGNLAFLLQLAAELEQAHVLCLEALGSARRHGQRRWEAMLLANLAQIEDELGRDPGPALERVIAMHRDQGNLHSEGVQRGVRADWLASVGRTDEAREEYLEAISLLADIGSEQAAARVRSNMAVCELEQGELDAATHQAREALLTLERVGDRRFEAQSRLVLAEVAVRQGDTPTATGELARAERLIDPADRSQQERMAELRSRMR